MVFPKIFNWNLLRGELMRWYEVLGTKTEIERDGVY